MSRDPATNIALFVEQGDSRSRMCSDKQLKNPPHCFSLLFLFSSSCKYFAEVSMVMVEKVERNLTDFKYETEDNETSSRLVNARVCGWFIIEWGGNLCLRLIDVMRHLALLWKYISLFLSLKTDSASVNTTCFHLFPHEWLFSTIVLPPTKQK